MLSAFLLSKALGGIPMSPNHVDPQAPGCTRDEPAEFHLRVVM